MNHLPAAKLNAILVRRIRAEHAEKEAAKRALDAQYSHLALARRYGVHKNTVSKVLSYATWKHVL